MKPKSQLLRDLLELEDNSLLDKYRGAKVDGPKTYAQIDDGKSPANSEYAFPVMRQPPMKLFAIRHEPTQCYLMARDRKRNGGTAEEPLPYKPGGARVPRMFASPSAARKALTCWLKGKYYTDVAGIEEYARAVLKAEPVESRKREQMAIVEFELREIELYG
jgi:hypothetical protein